MLFSKAKPPFVSRKRLSLKLKKIMFIQGGSRIPSRGGQAIGGVSILYFVKITQEINKILVPGVRRRPKLFYSDLAPMWNEGCWIYNCQINIVIYGYNSNILFIFSFMKEESLPIEGVPDHKTDKVNTCILFNILCISKVQAKIMTFFAFCFYLALDPLISLVKHNPDIYCKDVFECREWGS